MCYGRPEHRPHGFADLAHALLGCLKGAEESVGMQIPDIDAVLHTSDFPCMTRPQQGSKIVPPPVFGYNSHATFVDIPFPDYTYWGHEYSWLLGETPFLSCTPL